MMKIFYKVLASILLFSSIFITFMMGGILTNEGKNIVCPYIDTQFATHYSPEKFELIKTGQTIEKVESIIGEPLRKNFDSGNIRTQYCYRMDGKLSVNKKDGDFAWYISFVTFDSAGKVILIDKGWGYD